jgi:hypothetical protein
VIAFFACVISAKKVDLPLFYFVFEFGLFSVFRTYLAPVILAGALIGSGIVKSDNLFLFAQQQ